jgi:hypothetical protein
MGARPEVLAAVSTLDEEISRERKGSASAGTNKNSE